MAKKMLIDATHAEETRVVVVDGNKVEEFDFESENRRQLAGNIYLAKVTRVEPSLQAAFVDYGGNRHGFLAFSEIHPDYYQIPVADREALMEEERAYAESLKEEDEKPAPKRRRTRRSKPKAAEVKSDDAVETREIAGMDVVELDSDDVEGSSPMELVTETPVETPEASETPEVEEPTNEPVEASSDDVAKDTAEEKPAPAAEAAAEEPTVKEDASEGDDSDDDEDEKPLEATEKDDDIESVAEEDVTEEIRRPRKPRPKRYKIQEVIKVRQILLVQVVKEERGNKGAALTTYLSLAGRYCVLMPNTARGGGISRKITNADDRKKLKDIATEIDVPQGAGLIIRTAGAKRTRAEIKRDYEYLQRLWEQIRALTLKSVAPAKIYEEGDLIKRSIRDLYNREIDEVVVEGERGYRIAKDFMKMIMPSHAKNVKRYGDPLPLFARYQVESYLAGMFNPTVQLKSGGYIVIGVTEALVAIDVNSGRATKQGSIEETALNTNLEAAEEVARQLRLRDLAGLIVIDFIDMEERKNNSAVEKRIKDKLKTDRARIQIGRISGFGLMEMSRQRLRPGMIEATTQPCSACHGTGLIRSDDNLALTILRQLEEEGVRRRSREVLLKAPIGIINFLMNDKREHIASIESRYGLSIRIEADPFMISPDFSVERFKTATRRVPEATTAVVSVDTSLMDDIDEAEEAEEKTNEAVDNVEAQDHEGQPKKRRRRRRRRRGGKSEGEEGNQDASDAATSSDEENPQSEEAPVEGEAAEQTEDKPKRRRRRRSKSSDVDSAETADADAKPEADENAAEAEAQPAAEAQEEEKPKKRRRRSKKKIAEDEAAELAAANAASEAGEPSVETAATDTPAEPVVQEAAPVAAEPEVAPVAEVVQEAEPARAEPTPEMEVVAAVAEAAPEVAAEPSVETVPDEPAVVAEAPEVAVAEEVAVVEEPSPPKPKRRGWWSIGR
ncbi:Rne/Rng family ribonuclease [Cochlodiniinecator piscidefendens]|uniref:Rne/Rng family ribonuclease n=1 Tax=Cochlodiniinecator piscidefendens TaxID=2715756 RepID=UPI00140D908A|nr:ribonuclease E/G [Cochlodiniinecator piscidefendens]